jgi:hypothetical protein
MTMPAWKATGSFVSAANPASASIAWPAGHAAGDFGILIVETDVDTLATPSGFTAAPGTPVKNSGGNPSSLQIFYRFATSGAEANVSFSPSNHVSGLIITYTGVNTANPIHMIATHVLASSTVTRACPGLTTYIGDCLVLAIYSWHVDNAGPLSSGETNASLSSVVERFDAGTTDGNGGGIVVVEGGLAAPATIGPTTVTFSTGSAIASACLALQAANRTFANRSRAINTEM